jgi:ABC-type multidrug transport system ATPase subunit
MLALKRGKGARRCSSSDCSSSCADEPTTGLDSFQALNVMTALNDLANEGRTIICTIHQPRGKIFDLVRALAPLHSGLFPEV